MDSGPVIRVRVPALSFGTGTFGGGNDFFKAWGSTDATGASRLIDICLDHGVSMFDTADVYSGGLAEEILGQAIKGKRERLLVSTKATFPSGPGPNEFGSSRQHLVEGWARARPPRINHTICCSSTPRITTRRSKGPGHARTVGPRRQGPLHRLLQLLRWHLMKSLAASDRHGYPRHVAHQAYYSLLNRDYEWELMPLGLDQGVGGVMLESARVGQAHGKIRRGQPARPGTRAHDIAGHRAAHEDERLFRIVDALDAVAAEAGRPIPQVALNWLLQRPTVSALSSARATRRSWSKHRAIGWS